MPVSANDYLAGYLMALGVMTALKRRSIEGGSWHVRTSLARIAQWIESLGTIDPAKAANVPHPPPAGVISRFSFDTDSPLGVIRSLRPALELSQTPPYWSRPPVPVGYHQPVWPAREVVTVS